MNTITIPKKFTKGEELIILTKEEYDHLIGLRPVPEFEPTDKEKRDLVRARNNRKAGRFLTIHELRQKLGFTS